MKLLHLFKALPMWLFDSATMAVPPMLLNLSLPWPQSSAPGWVVGFFSAYAGLTVAWLLILSVSGYSRWRVWGTWRTGLRPCMCDKPTYCLRHRSSVREPNRPGVIAARLAEREDA